MPEATTELVSDVWLPPLFPKQLEVFNSRKRFVLVTGPRASGKTTAVLHRLLRHAWEVDHARLAMYSRTVKISKSAGPFAELVDSVIPIWEESGMCSPHADFGYTREPISEGATRMYYCRIRNYWGGESEIQLHSLKSDRQIEEKLMSTSFSLIYFSELHEFENPAVFDISNLQLRKTGVRFDDHMWIADCNPPESGPLHFAFDKWFTQLEMKEHPYPLEQAKYQRIEFTIDDNLSDDGQKLIQGVKNQYRDDPEGWQRFVEGKWTRSAGHSDKHFSMVFKKHVHIIGEIEDEDEDLENWEVKPSESCTQLYTGWDIGHVNNAFVIIERTYNENQKPVWWILDEVVWVAERVPLEEFGYAAVEQMEKIEKAHGKPVEWTHWADPSAFNYNAHGTDEVDAAVIYRISDSRIVFRWAARAKAPGTVRKRVEAIKRLLMEQRLFVAAHCFKTIEMFQSLRKGVGDRRYYERHFIARGDPHKHVFDAISYAIYSEMLRDLEFSDDDTKPSFAPRSILVPL